MKKYLFFQWAFYCLLSLNLSAQYITYPVDGSVFQQNTSNQATVTFTFSEINSYNKTIFYRIKNANGTVVTGKDRVVLSSPTFTNGGGLKGYHVTETLSKGWYTVEFYHEWQFKFLIITKTSNRLVESKQFGVGDVYFVAGQSNASGYNDNQFDNVISYSSDNSFYYQQTDNTMVRTLNILENIPQNQITRGLPKEGFMQLTKTPMYIYPNGISSWCWAPLGNELANRNGTPTLFFNIAYPNTSLIYDWIGLNPKYDKNSSTTLIGKFYQTLGVFGNVLGAKSVLWHQGERDSQILAGYGNNAADVTNNYSNYLEELVNASRTNTGLSNLPWFVSKVSYSSRGNNVVSSCTVDPSTSTGYKDKYDNLNLKSYQVKNNDPNVFQGVTSDFIDDDDWEGNSTDFSNSTTECIRAPMQRIHFSGDWLGKLGHAWYKTIDENYEEVIGKEATQLLKLNSVNKSGNNFTFVIQLPPTQAATFYWCKNDFGINNALISSTNTSPSITLQPGERVICYVKDISGKFYASQPYIRNDCSNCRSGINVFSISPTTLNFNGNSETKSISFTRANNDWDLQHIPSWVSDITWDDANQKLNISVSQNQGIARSDYLEFVNLGTTNVISTLNLTQSANSTCTQTNLSSLTPTNPSSEWQGYAVMKNNLSITGQTLTVAGYQTANGIGTHANSRIVYNLGGQYSTFTGSVGRDDAADNCSCGTMRLQFIIKADGETKFTSALLTPTHGKESFSVNVTGKSQLELIVNDGGDNVYGDHADWLDAILYCGAAPACTTPPPAPNDVTSSPSSINPGSSSTLSATC